jgi:gag-polyprotein putative aspartyl protease
MTVNHKPVQALCDTGCAASCISEEYAKKMKLIISPPPDSIRLISANNSPIENVGSVDVELCIQGLYVPFTFCVLRSLSHAIILGCDFFRETQAVISYGTRSISLYDQLVCAPLTFQSDKTALLRLLHDVTIPPLSEAILRVKVPEKYVNKICTVATYEPIKSRQLLTAAALIEPKTSTSICRIANFSNAQRRL